MLDPIDRFVIEKVKQKRLALGYSQAQLANELDMSHGFIGKVEGEKYLQKYSISQVNKIAKLFKCSPKDFFPEKPM